MQLALVNIVQAVSDERLYYFLFFIFWLLCFPYFYWLNAAVRFLYNNKKNNNFKIDFINFKISLLVNLITVFNFIFFVAYIFSFIDSGESPNINIIGFMGFIQFIGVVSFAYNGYFISKLLATLDLEKKVYFSDISGNFILFSFPLASVWIIQGKIRKMLGDV